MINTLEFRAHSRIQTSEEAHGSQGELITEVTTVINMYNYELPENLMYKTVLRNWVWAMHCI